ncbi:MAG: DUF1579 domain-containing protein [Planctomycetes bacterium]|nr:DUF1579 domain-containing protein [Planctomycetota bacterium]
MIRCSAFVAIAAILFSRGAFAQEFPQPGPEHKYLAEMEGTWDARVDMGGEKSKGVSTYKLICGGMWIASDFQGDIGGAKFQGHGVDGYDQHKKKYVAVWVDSMESAPMHLVGDFDAKTKTMTMKGETFGLDGKPQPVKTTTVHKDKNTMVFTMYAIGPDNKDQPILSITYTRRK